MNESAPVGWEVVPLQSIAKKYNGSIVDGPFGSNLKVSDYVDSGVPVLQGKNVTNDVFVWSDVRYVSEQKAEEIKRSSVRVGDILMVKIGSVGYSAIVDNLNGYESAIIPANLLKISLNKDVASIEYVHQYLTSPTGKRRIIDAASSTAQPALNLGVIKNFKIPVPPLQEQQKIASILTSVDEVIEKTQSQINKLKDLKKAMMQELLTKGIGHTEFKDSPVGRIPRSWKVVRVEDVISSKIRDFGSFSTTKLIEFLEEGIPFVKSESVKDGRIDFDSISYISEEVHQVLDKSYVRNRTILFTKIGAIGRVAVYRGELGECNSNAATAKIEINESVAGIDFVAYLLGSERVMRAFEKTIISTPPRINLGEINSKEIPLPSLPEQQKIVSVLTSIDKNIENKQRKLQQTQSLKKALMEDLLTGKVRVKV
jgi:type I restriction enzyme, S subunit